MTDETTNETAPEQPTWYIDEGVPGVGQRPEWLGEKFKSAADLAKSYKELEQKFFTAPEEYDISRSKFLDADYQPIQDFLAIAKEKRVPKDVIDKMVDSLDRYMDEFSIDYEEETKKLGENSKDRLNTLDNWAKANLSETSYAALTANLKSADAIKALEEIRGKMMSNTTMIPPGNDNASSGSASVDEIQAEISENLAKYKSDPKYRKDLEGRLAVAVKNNPAYIDKSGH